MSPVVVTVQVVTQIVGERPMPWEDAARAKQLLRTASIFRAPVLTLLQRDPEDSPL
jgi:hypothetical protein